MPASYFHEQSALGALDALQKSVRDFDVDRAALLAGSQGPDPLFFYQMLSTARDPSLYQWALRLHTEQPGAFLRCLLRRGGSEPFLRDYALGFLTHYATDTVLHPYVFAHSFDEQGAYRNDRHGLLEAAMDTALYRRPGNRGTPTQMNGIRALSRPRRAQIATLLRCTMEEVYGESPLEAALAKALDDCVLITRLLHSDSGLTVSLLSTVTRAMGQPLLIKSHTPPARLPREDFLNQCHGEWSSPWQRQDLRRDGVADLFAQAQIRGCELMRAALNAWHGKITWPMLAAIIGDLQYDSGLEATESFVIEEGQMM